MRSWTSICGPFVSRLKARVTAKSSSGPSKTLGGMAFDCVFLPGLMRGSLSRPFREDPLLLNEERESYGMPKIDEDRGARTSETSGGLRGGQFIGSYSRIDLATGRARVPSLYAYDVLRAARGHAFDPAELQKHAESNVETTLAWPAPHD